MNLMKILRFYVSALSFYFLTGCLPIQPLNEMGIFQNSSQNNSQNNSQNSSGCSTQPTTVLKTNDVKLVSLNSQTITESGMVTNNKSLGYTFIGKTGNKLVYQTNQNICIWVYTPDNKLMNNPVLPVDGKYIIQIGAMEGATTFDLALQLEDNTQAVNLSSSPTPITTTEIEKPSSPKPVTTTKIKKSSSPKPVTTTKIKKTQTQKTTNNISPKENISEKSISVSTIPNRISPAKAIENYYTMINNQQYDSAWDIYPTEVKEDKELHPNGYDSFIEWWTKVNYVNVNNVSIASENNDSAIVNFRSRYEMKNGKSIPVILKFYLVWNQENENWYVTKIKLINS
ncbi:hypothetical protein PN497_11745 [Sphaerospermopsis kisseleviana CS-549]|uniref:ARC6 IMS domain-containing protein n=1 Tax=Sphaerospermopsis kisseleviana CS-549 TaxID=3021783 RepID=A0ABT4ZTE6_9CYAN|nr:hypothetical protein [Sphaerospermopsis kisseleviana]MDB9442028.1 hypothetical protein [Sphaerospermopsis kisseleviana CS-549]